MSTFVPPSTATTTPCSSPSPNNNVSSTESPLSTMSGISHISAASATQATKAFDLVDDAYSQFERTYGGGFEDNVNKEHTVQQEGDDVADEDDATSSDSSTFYDLFLSLYLPVALVWLRRGMFGTASLFRSLVLGHCLRLVFSNASEWMTEKAPWLQPVLFQQATVNGKIGTQAWPPPALTALALLTILTLVVHPDGFTWIMLGKLRDAMLSLLNSSTTCWSIIVKDFGVIPSIAALATLAALLFLMLLMRRTLTPRKSPKRNTQSHDRKKKKKKGHTRHRGSGNGGTSTRIKPPVNNANVIPPPASPKTSLLHNQTQCPPSSPSRILEETAADFAAAESLMLKSSPLDNPGGDLSTKSADGVVNSASKSQSSERGRSRFSSVSTLDTTAMSDDQSCGSTSVRSAPSVGVSSTALGSVGEQSAAEKGKAPKKPSRKNNNSSNNNGSRRQHNRRGGKSSKFDRSAPGSHDKTPADVPMVPSSRWDALKPSPSHNNHHRHDHHQRPSGRRNASNKKGRSTFAGGSANNTRHSAPTDSFFSRAPSSTSASTKVNRQSQPESCPPITQRFLSDNSTTLPSLLSSNNSPDRSTAHPGPPPGLGPLASGGANSTTLSTNLYRGNTNHSETVLLTSTATTFDWQYGSDRASMASPTLESPPLHQKDIGCTKWIEGDDLKRVIGAGVVQSQLQLHHQLLGSSGNVSSSRFSPSFTGGRVKENPFAPDDGDVADSTTTKEPADYDSRIEADLQELGGQMAGSILD